jgi:23S rRNA (adenine2503-C2)-methyltransferase
MNKYYPLSQLITACKDYVKLTNRRITFEYVLINKINDSQVLALQLVALLRNLLCHVNLIAYNPIEDQSFSVPSLGQIHDFYQVLITHGIQTTIRRSFGTEIKAGCGQLAGKI